MSFQKSIFFHVVEPSKGTKFHPVYQYDYIPLAQGLKKMGFQIYSNINYWKGLDGDYLFKANSEVSPKDCSINVFSGLCQHHNYPFDMELLKNRNICKVLIEQNDGFFTPLFSDLSKNFDVILHKKNTNRKYPSNCKSAWSFGLSHEIIQLSELYKQDFEKKENEILINFRYGHPVRNYGVTYLKKLYLNLKLNDKVNDFDFDEYKGTQYEEMLTFNGGRHRPDYLERMSGSKVCATFGGFFYFDKIADKGPKTYRLGNYLLAERAGGLLVELIRKSGLYIRKTKNIYQWDSWRFWETFACGTVNVNFDLSFYGIELPVQPINNTHYIGLNFHKPKSYNEQLLNVEKDKLKHIAESGREWAINNYGPEAIAKRFLLLLNN